MSAPINYDAMPSALSESVRAWHHEIYEGYPELVRAARDTAFHFGRSVGDCLDMPDSELKENGNACTEWGNYLSQYWSRVEAAWTAVQQHGVVPEDVRNLDWVSRQQTSAAVRSLYALASFFWSAASYKERTEANASEAMAQYDSATESEGPNAAPLPNPWEANPNPMPRDVLVRHILITHQGMEQHSVVEDGDIDMFTTLG